MIEDFFFNTGKLTGGIDRDLAEGIKTSIFAGDQAMLSIVRFEPDAVGSIHDHPEEQWGICLSGGGIRIQAGERISVEAGDFWLTPGSISPERLSIATPEICPV